MNRFWVLLLAFAAIAANSCKKDAENNTATTLNIRLTDGPGAYDQVNIDLLEIRVKTSDDTSKWLSIPTNAGVYNLLEFQNGIDTLIATGPVPLVTLKELRFVLGPNSTVMQDSMLYPLQTPSAESSGLKVKIDKSLSLNLNTFVLDFDAEKSVHGTGSGKFILKPVIKLK